MPETALYSRKTVVSGSPNQIVFNKDAICTPQGATGKITKHKHIVEDTELKRRGRKCVQMAVREDRRTETRRRRETNRQTETPPPHGRHG